MRALVASFVMIALAGAAAAQSGPPPSESVLQSTCGLLEQLFAWGRSIVLIISAFLVIRVSVGAMFGAFNKQMLILGLLGMFLVGSVEAWVAFMVPGDLSSCASAVFTGENLPAAQQFWANQ
ncbi:hypothetical protein [Tranquillimonas alkanivorans]|uniref:TrbC/VIRB2 family protein n=1 Tax=Tranquillimonas alkanivorans TaxID=441119 RepID=A0A1I5WEW9_9RHOB|nr:hypothetical protein [Tranquillimonas alkanivorans]SFQ18275.1 hypothetical protein SAMN04488047_1456 [Tranquillimonas alkanivorans]